MRSIRCKHCSGIALFNEEDANDFTAFCQSCGAITDGKEAQSLMKELEIVLEKLGTDQDKVKEWCKCS